MTFPDVSYEEYANATRFARFRYQYGFFVLVLCWISLLLLLFFIWNYAEELAAQPGQYLINKLDAERCLCYADDTTYLINKTTTSFHNDPYSIFGIG